MKIAVCDLIFAKGHVSVNLEFIRQMLKFAEVTVYDDGKYYSELPNDVRRTIVSISQETPGSIRGRLQYYKNAKRQIVELKKDRPDLVFVMTNDAIVFRLVVKSFLKFGKKIFIIQHNPSELQNGIKRKFFKGYCNKVYHLVLDTFMIDDLYTKYGVERNRIFLLPHPLKSFLKNVLVKNRVVALSGSNDEEKVKEIVNLMQTTDCPKDFQLILRSSKLAINIPNLVVYNRYLSREEYEMTMAEAKAVLILLPAHFQCRVSGVAFEALANQKIIIANRVPCIESLHNRYPNNVKIYDNMQQALHMAFRTGPLYDEKEYARLIQDHGTDAVAEAIKKIIFTK